MLAAASSARKSDNFENILRSCLLLLNTILKFGVQNQLPSTNMPPYILPHNVDLTTPWLKNSIPENLLTDCLIVLEKFMFYVNRRNPPQVRADSCQNTWGLSMSKIPLTALSVFFWTDIVLNCLPFFNRGLFSLQRPWHGIQHVQCS